jgi:pimeloyl-ACP methyl ester carboxylesterase
MFAKVNGIQLAYTDEGEGLPMVLLHGFPLSRGAWSKQVEAFKGRHRVITPDLRGFGESESTSGIVSMQRLAEDIHALTEQLATGPVILAGHSMGGYVALAFANAFPKALRGLMLVATKAGTDSSEAAAARHALAEKVRAQGPAVVVDAMAPKMLAAGNADARMAAAVRGIMKNASTEGVIATLLGMAERPDENDRLDQIRVPTLVIAGSEDTVIPPSESEALAKAIPGAQLVLIPRAGHLVAFEQARAFNDAVRNWLAWGSHGLARSLSSSATDFLT